MKTARTILFAGLIATLATPVVASQTKQRAAKPRPAAPAAAPATAPAAAAPAAAPAPDSQAAVTTPSGLTCIFTRRANGVRPAAGQTVLVHYTGLLSDGTKFDSSHDRREPIAFSLGRGQVIKGWDEGIGMLGVGDTAVLIIPPELGYGARGAGGVIPPNALLIFVVELIDVRGEALSTVLMKTIEASGIEAAIAEYRQRKAAGFGGLFVSEGDLNMLGYKLLNMKKIAEATEILKLVVESWPQSANAYDSLGEAYMLGGDTTRAIENYEKSLALDPNNANAAEVLKRLKTP